MSGIYYIKNSIDAFESGITGYFPSLEIAKESLKHCAEWYRENGTGRIYFVEYGLDKPSILVFESKGLDKNGNLIEKDCK